MGEGMSQSTLSIILNVVGLSFGMFLAARYRLWKTSRREIPMEEQNGIWVPDGKLKRWERRVFWIWILGTLFGLAFCIFMLRSAP